MRSLFILLVFSLPSLHAAVTSGEMLTTAVMRGDLKTMESLLSAGFNPNLPLRDGQTPLSFAMLNGQTPAVELLLAWHADPNALMNSRLAESETPLQYAAEAGNLHMASILIAGGAQLNKRAPNGRTSLTRRLVAWTCFGCFSKRAPSRMRATRKEPARSMTPCGAGLSMRSQFCWPMALA